MSRRRKFNVIELPDKPNLSFEIALWEQGIDWIAGIDEAGRGALAGPVTVGVVVLPADPEIGDVLFGVRDSKQMRPNAREYWRTQLLNVSAAYSIGSADNKEIDDLGIVNAENLAIRRALSGLKAAPKHLLLDYFSLPNSPIPQTSLVKGDARSLSIAAASILAKTARDQWMIDADNRYPIYGFAEHKGYGTLRHREALRLHGLSPIHRESYHLHK